MAIAVCQASSWPNRGAGPAQPVTKQLKEAAQRLVSAWHMNVKTLQIGYVHLAVNSLNCSDLHLQLFLLQSDYPAVSNPVYA